MIEEFDYLKFIKMENVKRKFSLHFKKVFDFLIKKWHGDVNIFGEIPEKFYDDSYKKFFTTLHDFFKNPSESKNGIGVRVMRDGENLFNLVMEELPDIENADQNRWFITVTFWEIQAGSYTKSVDEKELILDVINYLEALYLWWKEWKEKETKLFEEVKQKHNKINHDVFNIK